MGQSAAHSAHRLVTAELPEGWTAFEGVELRSPSGSVIALTTRRASDDLDVMALAMEDTDALRAGLTGFHEMSLERTTAFGAVPAVDRRFVFEADQTTWRGRVVYALDAGNAYIVGASWGPDQTEVEGDLDEALGALGFADGLTTSDDRPPGRRATDSDLSPPPGELTELAPAGPLDWSRLRVEWERGAERSPTEAETTRWSVDELLVCAILRGGAGFPTVSNDVVADVPASWRPCLFGRVARSFVARGIASIENGDPVLAESVAGMVDTALLAPLSVTVEVLEPGEHRHSWIGLTPERATEVTVVPDGSRDTRELDPGCLVDRIVDLMHLDPCTTSTEPPRTFDIDELGDGWSDTDTLVRVHTTWQEGTELVSGVVAWNVDEKRALSAAHLEPLSEGGVRCRLESADPALVREQIRVHLPD